MAAGGPGVNQLISNGDFLEYRVVCSFGVQTSFNVRHMRVSGVGVPIPNLGDCATAINAIMAPLWKAVMSNQCTYRGVMVRRVRPLPPSPPAWENGSQGVGTVATEPLPNQVAGVISLYTNFAGRRYRGRLYIPFPAEGDNTVTSIPSAGYLTGLGNIGGAVLGIITNPNTKIAILTPILYHRLDGTSNDLVGTTTRTVWGTQRKRGGFGRANPPPF